MTDQLISFKTAKLAKEKGYDGECEQRYDENGNLTATKLGMYMHPNSYSNSYAASTQSLLQKWLRDIYNIHIIIEPSYYGTITKKLVYFMHTTRFGNFIVQDSNTTFYNTYEKALEKGLEISLNQI